MPIIFNHFNQKVNSAKQTFSGFVRCTEKKNARYGVEFISLPTYITWWFSWASAMHIDFRQKCLPCGESCETLVGDGTKIGVGMYNIMLNNE